MNTGENEAPSLMTFLFVPSIEDKPVKFLRVFTLARQEGATSFECASLFVAWKAFNRAEQVGMKSGHRYFVTAV